MLTLSGITVRLGGHAVLNGVQASIARNGRVGLVGRNGAGKSTLLKVIAGLHEADDGTVETPRGTRIGYLAQDTPRRRRHAVRQGSGGPTPNARGSWPRNASRRAANGSARSMNA